METIIEIGLFIGACLLILLTIVIGIPLLIILGVLNIVIFIVKFIFEDYKGYLVISGVIVYFLLK